MLEVARKHHLEGIVAKNIASIYQPGKRSRDWIKSPLRANCEAVVCGFLPGSGGAARGVGSLILGATKIRGASDISETLVRGLTDRQRSELRDKLTAHRLAKSAPKIAASRQCPKPVHPSAENVQAFGNKEASTTNASATHATQFAARIGQTRVATATHIPHKKPPPHPEQRTREHPWKQKCRKQLQTK